LDPDFDSGGRRFDHQQLAVYAQLRVLEREGRARRGSNKDGGKEQSAKREHQCKESHAVTSK
jgi:hypothetical protein